MPAYSRVCYRLHLQGLLPAAPHHRRAPCAPTTCHLPLATRPLPLTTYYLRPIAGQVRANHFGFLLGQYTAPYGADEAHALATADAGPLDEGYVGGGS